MTHQGTLTVLCGQQRQWLKKSLRLAVVGFPYGSAVAGESLNSQTAMNTSPAACSHALVG